MVLNVEIGRMIDERKDTLAEAILAQQFQLQPALMGRYNQYQLRKCIQDIKYHLSYLSAALLAARPALFADYVAWAKVFLVSIGVGESALSGSLQVTRDVLHAQLPTEMIPLVDEYIGAGLGHLPQMPAEAPSFINLEASQGLVARRYLDALLQGDRQAASRLVLDAVRDGVSVKDIYLGVFQPCQHEIGRLWQMNKASVAQEHYCTAATQLIMSQLYPYIFTAEKKGRTLVATCVNSELHEIGVRMIADLFELDGWDTYYLGANTPADSIVRAVADRQADVLAISATISSHVQDVSGLIASVRSARLHKPPQILVGGYPFNVAPDLWTMVGADGYARNATEAIAAADRLLVG